MTEAAQDHQGGLAVALFKIADTRCDQSLMFAFRSQVMDIRKVNGLVSTSLDNTVAQRTFVEPDSIPPFRKQSWSLRIMMSRIACVGSAIRRARALLADFHQW